MAGRDRDRLVRAGDWAFLATPRFRGASFPVTLGHFFLFCNVFRLRRSYELFWSVLFLANIGFWLSRDELRWAEILAMQTPLTIALILLEMRSPNYHGVFWARLNPGFDVSEKP